MEPHPRRRRSLTPVFSGQPSSVMLMTWCSLVMLARGRATSHHEMRCPSDRFSYRYILVAVDYVSKWVEAQALPTNDARSVVKFLKKLFSRFGALKALISDRGTHFCNAQLEKALSRLRSRIGASRGSWRKRLVRTVRIDPRNCDALWAFRTAYKTRIGTTPFKLVYGKVCHLPVELEHKEYWALKSANLDLACAGKNRMGQLHKLEELRGQAYENSRIYKERIKKLHDARLKDHKQFQAGDRVLLYNSHLRLFPGKLKSRWSGPFSVRQVFEYGTIKIDHEDGRIFKVNDHHLKHYLGEPVETVLEVVDLHPMI
ncbi:uncharacterized protein LOC143552282 [Bidens hawaiensis]|uniref:uncharacterized protein LOC143552282 n=1 Tax=Bidens hawaiensis TaxID=980011 RepID=UPI00404924D8